MGGHISDTSVQYTFCRHVFWSRIWIFCFPPNIFGSVCMCVCVCVCVCACTCVLALVYVHACSSCSVISYCLWSFACSQPGSFVHGIFYARIVEWFTKLLMINSNWFTCSNMQGTILITVQPLFLFSGTVPKCVLILLEVAMFVLWFMPLEYTNSLYFYHNLTNHMYRWLVHLIKGYF